MALQTAHINRNQADTYVVCLQPFQLLLFQVTTDHSETNDNNANCSKCTIYV